jgi:hypothetical protein
MLRGQSLRRPVDAKERLWQLWRALIVERNIADLSTWDQIERSGLQPAWFVDDDPLICWVIAGDLRRAGYRGLLSPSAASHADEINLTLFGPRREAPVNVPNRNPDFFLEVDPEGDMTNPPAEVYERVRYRGEPHASLGAWLSAKA